MAHIRYAEPDIAGQMLAPPSVILGAVPGHTARGMTAFAWPSYAWFSNEVLGRGAFADSDTAHWFRPFTSVMFDPERWAATPLVERRDPVISIRSFTFLAHAHGWTVIVSPNPSLMRVPGAVCGVRGSETQEEAYLRCNIAGQAARYADVIETQAQSLEAQPSAYRSFVERTAAQARAANPQVKVIAGLTTGRAYTAAQMYAAWASVRDVVDGFYLSISGDDRVATALAFLRELPWAGQPSSRLQRRFVTVDVRSSRAPSARERSQ